MAGACNTKGPFRTAAQRLATAFSNSPASHQSLAVRLRSAARTAKVPLRTIYRWLRDPAFSSQYRHARRDSFGQALARLQQGSSAAASTMLRIMVDTTLPASTRLRASEYVFTHAMNGIEMEEIEARIAALEEAAERSKQL